MDENGAWNLDRYGMASGYALTKKRAEEIVLEAAAGGLDAVVVNPAYMLGPWDWKPGSNKIILDVVKRRIPGYPGGLNNYVDVRDVARGIRFAADRGRTGERYLLGGYNLDYQTLFRKIAGAAGVEPITRPLPKWLAGLVGRLGDCGERITGRENLFNSTGIAYSFADCCYSSKKAEMALGYKPSPLEPAIKDAVEWFRLNGYL